MRSPLVYGRVDARAISNFSSVYARAHAVSVFAKRLSRQRPYAHAVRFVSARDRRVCNRIGHFSGRKSRFRASREREREREISSGKTKITNELCRLRLLLEFFFHVKLRHEWSEMYRFSSLFGRYSKISLLPRVTSKRISRSGSSAPPIFFTMTDSTEHSACFVRAKCRNGAEWQKHSSYMYKVYCSWKKYLCANTP